MGHMALHYLQLDLAHSHTCQGPVCLTLPEAERQHMHRLKLDKTYLGGDISEALTPSRSQPVDTPRTLRRPRGGEDPPADRKSKIASSRRTAMLYCPFTGCPNTQVAQSADALIKHLSRVHVTAGQPILQDIWCNSDKRYVARVPNCIPPWGPV